MARLVAEDDLPDREIAVRVRMSRTSLNRWKRKPEFWKVVEEYRRQVEQEVFSTGIALKVNRLMRLNKHAERIESIFKARAAALGERTPGGESGLITHDLKSIGSGEAAQIVDVYEFDAALHKEYRATMEQAAKEMGGQFEESKDAGSINAKFNISFPVINIEQAQAELDNAPTADLPPAHKRLLSRPSDGKKTY